MSNKNIFLFLIISTLSFKSSNQINDQVNRIVNAYLSNPENAGIAIGIISGNSDYVFCFGDACKKENIKIDTNTIFEIGSITKIFTGLLLANEVENHKLSLEDNINLYLPQCNTSQKITLLSLATHSSGLPRLADNFWETVKYPDNPYVSYGEKDLNQYLLSLKLDSTRIPHYNYSNVGVGILGYILAAKNNASYEKLVSEIICKPLSMNSTIVQLNKNQKEHLAVGYNHSEPVLPWDFNDATAGQGALRSTITDMMKFLKCNLFFDTPLKNSIQLSQEIQFTDYEKEVAVGLGWHVGHIKGQKYLFHSGATGGYRSYIGMLPDSKNGIVILSNSTNDVDGIGFSILKQVVGEGIN